MPVPKDKPTRKNLETLFTGVLKPSFNEQVRSNVLHLFQNSIVFNHCNGLLI